MNDLIKCGVNRLGHRYILREAERQGHCVGGEDWGKGGVECVYLPAQGLCECSLLYLEDMKWCQAHNRHSTMFTESVATLTKGP